MAAEEERGRPALLSSSHLISSSHFSVEHPLSLMVGGEKKTLEEVLVRGGKRRGDLDLIMDGITLIGLFRYEGKGKTIRRTTQAALEL